MEMSRQIDEKKLSDFFRKLYGNQFFGVGQSLYFDFGGIQMIARIIQIELMESGISKLNMGVGMLVEDSDIEFSSTDNQMMKIKSSDTKVYYFKL